MKVTEMKKVLIIARAFPPFLSVGHSIRAVKFIKYLPALDWLPVVLTIKDDNDYETINKVGSESMLQEIPPEVKVIRTTAGEPSVKFLEDERRFAQRNILTALIVKVFGAGRRWALRTLLLPDRHLAWLPFALQRGRQIVRSEDIDVIFATCPPHSATIVGAFLKVLTQKPLILDYRDDWIDTPWYKSRRKLRRMLEKGLERWVVKMADKVILVTEWSQKAFQARYPGEPSDKFILIPNGVDLKDFEGIRTTPALVKDSKFTILHTGSLNDSTAWARSPDALFQAVHNIIQEQPELAEELEVVFAGDFPSGHRQLAEECSISSIVKGTGHLSHNDVLRLIKSANLLLAINYEGFATLIPGKIYEYWAAGGPPILLLSCPGAAADFIEQRKLGITVDPSDIAGIKNAILNVYQQAISNASLCISPAGIEAYDRQALTHKLAKVLSLVSDHNSGNN